MTRLVDILLGVDIRAADGWLVRLKKYNAAVYWRKVNGKPGLGRTPKRLLV